MLATKFEKVFTQGTCISFQNIIIEISENMLFFAAFLGKPVKVNTALKGLITANTKQNVHDLL